MLLLDTVISFHKTIQKWLFSLFYGTSERKVLLFIEFSNFVFANIQRVALVIIEDLIRQKVYSDTYKKGYSKGWPFCKIYFV